MCYKISIFLEFFNAVDNFNIQCKHRQIMKMSSNEPTCFYINWPYLNKCIGDDTKAATHQSLKCIKNKKNMAKNDFQYAGWNSYTLQCGTITTLISSGDCTLQCGSGIVTVNSPSGSTVQCDTWHWDEMPLNSPKRMSYCNSTSGCHFHTSPQSTCHSVSVCEILSKSDHPRQKK